MLFTMSRGRIQAQGEGTEESISWAQEHVPTKNSGHEMVNSLKKKLTKKQIKERQYGFDKVNKAIDEAPSDGMLATIRTSFVNKKISEDKRIDLEVLQGKAFNYG